MHDQHDQHDQLHEAVTRAAEHFSPEKTWMVGPDAEIRYGSGPNPFHGLVISSWPE